MYAYCRNNPVMCVDPTGESITVAIIVGTLIGAAIGFGGTLYTDYSDDGEVFNGSVSAVGYIGNTAMGGLIGSFCGYFAPAISGFMSSSFTLGIPKMMGDVVAMQMVTVTGAQLVAGGAMVAGAGMVLAANMLGENGTQTESHSFRWRGAEGQNERIDVENPNPGQRPGQIHYHEVNNTKHMYDFYTQKFEKMTPRLEKLMKDKNFLGALKRAYKYLGEPVPWG